MSDLMGDRLRSLVVLERICNLYDGLSPGKTHRCCRMDVCLWISLTPVLDAISS